MGMTYADDAPSTWPAEAAHAASEFDDEAEREREQRDVSPVCRGLLTAIGLTAACLIVAHLIAGVVR